MTRKWLKLIYLVELFTQLFFEACKDVPNFPGKVTVVILSVRDSSAAVGTRCPSVCSLPFGYNRLLSPLHQDSYLLLLFSIILLFFSFPIHRVDDTKDSKQ